MGWKFVCDSSTERECLARRLFGDSKKHQVEAGDTVFLHNRESGFLMGPFRADGSIDENLEPQAWDGRFPWQVRVTWNQPVYGIAVKTGPASGFGGIREKPFDVDFTDRFQKLVDGQVSHIVEVLQDSDLSQVIIHHDG